MGKPKPKPKAPPCPNGCKNKNGRPYKMHRLYLRRGNRFKSAAWICLRCQKIKNDEKRCPLT